MSGQNINAKPFVPSWMRAEPPAPAPAPAPAQPPGHPDLSAAAPEWAPGGEKQQQPMFDADGRMIRNVDEQLFFTTPIAAAVPQVVVGRGMLPTPVATSIARGCGPGATPDPAPETAASPQPNDEEHRSASAGAEGTEAAPEQGEAMCLANVSEIPLDVDGATGACFTTPPVLTRPMVVLIIGRRGAGKSTQAALLAERFNMRLLSSGDLARADRKPLVALDEALKDIVDAHQRQGKKTKAGSDVGTAGSSGSHAEATYGLVLDRFVDATSDIYYVISMVRAHGLEIDLTVHLHVEADCGIARADERDDDKPHVQQRRLMENACIEDAVHVLKRYGGYSHVDAGQPLPDVTHTVNTLMQRAVLGVKLKAAGARRVCQSAPPLCSGLTREPDFRTFIERRDAVYRALGTPVNKYDAFPGSLMTGIVNEETLGKLKKTKAQFHVTWKADGTRVLLVRYRDGRLMCFPSKFTTAFIVDPKLVPPQWEGDRMMHCLDQWITEHPPGKLQLENWLADKPADTEGDVTHIFDAELVDIQGNRNRLMLFDLLYAEIPGSLPLVGSKFHFPKRLEAMKCFAGAFSSNSVWGFFACKDYMSAKNIGALIKVKPPYATDGVVFQHDNVYRVPFDPFIYKWKPQELCGADVRLAGPSTSGDGKTTTFEAFVLDRSKDHKAEEVRYPEAVVRCTAAELAQHHLVPGTVVEVVKTPERIRHGDGSRETVWTLLRPRHDKQFPNFLKVVRELDDMMHVGEDELVKFCATL